MDISSIATVLGSIKTATDIAKVIKDSDLSLQDAELKLKLADLISSLADAKIEIADIKSELIGKQEKISELERQNKLEKEMSWDPPYYWRGEISDKDGPYCQKCFDAEQKVIRLQGNGEGFWECKVCKSNYTDSTHDSPSFMSISSSEGIAWDGY